MVVIITFNTFSPREQFNQVSYDVPTQKETGVIKDKTHMDKWTQRRSVISISTEAGNVNRVKLYQER